jgi:hypothetical protein
VVLSDIKPKTQTSFFTHGEKSTFNNDGHLVSKEVPATFLCLYFDPDYSSEVLLIKIIIMVLQAGGIIHDFGIDYMICIWTAGSSIASESDSVIEVSHKILDLLLVDSLIAAPTKETVKTTPLFNHNNTIVKTNNPPTITHSFASAKNIKTTDFSKKSSQVYIRRRLCSSSIFIFNFFFVLSFRIT